MTTAAFASRYELLEPLGEGGTGTVFRARDLVEDRTVALKAFDPSPEGAGTRSRLLARSEFRLLTSQSHPGIVRVFDFGKTADGREFFTMELLRGVDIKTFMARFRAGPEAPEVFLDLVRQVLRALEYLHRRSVLHLDLKPSNILVVTGDGAKPVAKLIDFGLARERGVTPDGVSGTAEYIAPELLRGERPDARADLYSLGTVLYEILVGQPPFLGVSASEVVRGHLEGPLPSFDSVPADWRGVIPRLLERDPAKRFQSAALVLEALPGPGERPGEESGALLPPFEAAFVGREGVLGELCGLARAAVEGTPRTLLLRGASGVGKTRLLRELEVRLQLEGLGAGMETCLPGSASPGELLARLVRRASQSDEVLTKRVASDVAALRSGSFGDRTDAVDAEGRRERLLHLVARVLLELASRQPVVLLVDDVQLADTLSRDGLIQIARAAQAAGESKLFLVMAGSDDNSEAVEALEHALRGQPSFRSSRLRGLELIDVEKYLSHVFGEGAVPEDLPARLFEETAGNIYFIEESLKLLVRTGRLRTQGRRWEFDRGSEVIVPRTVGDVVRQRISRLELESREVLEWVSVLERPVTPEEIATCAFQGTSADRLESLLSTLVLEQLLRRQGPRHGFAHASARLVAYAGIGEERRREMHARAASCLASDPDRIEEIAHHLYHAGEARTARDHLKQAGDRARRTGSLREAVVHYSRALEVEDAPRERFELLLARQEVHGLVGRKDAQREDLSALWAIARALGEAPLEREAATREALYLESLGRKREALERLEAARARCAGSSIVEARLLSRGAMLRFYLSDFAAGFAEISEALEHARAAKDRSLEAECLQVKGLGHYLASNLDEAVGEMNRALVIRNEEGEEPRAASLESNLGLIHLDRGDLEAAEERFQASLKLFRRIGFRRGETVSLLNLGLVYLEMGRDERALDAFTASLRIRKELGDRRGEGADLGNLGAAWIQVGRYERALPLLEEALKIAREYENRQSESANECRLAQISLARGELAPARGQFLKALEIARNAKVASQELQALVGLSRAALALGDLASAEDAAREALRLAETGKMRLKPAWIRSVLAAVLLESGRLDEADQLTREAVEPLEMQPISWVEAPGVWFQRYRVLEALAGEGAGDDALRRAYGLVRARADAFQDEELRQSCLDNVWLHREVNRLHEALQARNRREVNRRERSFHEIAKSLHSITEIDPLLDRLLDLAIETTHGEKGLITLKNKGGDFTTRAARGMARESVDDASDICKSVIGDVARGGEPVLAVDAGSDERFRDRRSIVSFRIRTLLCVPMKVHDEILGAVYVDGRGASSFDREDLEYLLSFAQLAAIAVENARLLDRLRAENLHLRREVETHFRFENLIGSSPAMARLMRLMEKVAATPASILICGETGTGKEVIARSIHYASPRRAKPFVAVDCGALPENLLESELFGHRRGAFSGAVHDRVGLFEEAEGGTLFLDEVTNTSLDLQAKLLRVLQEGEIRRVGENQMRKVDVRVIAATNVDLQGAVRNGTFREDLYYRLNVIAIDVPPLRDRKEDIPVLARHFFAKSCERHGRALDGLTDDAAAFLSRAAWRGNVRELENLLEKAVILADGDRLDASFLESLMSDAAKPPRNTEAAPGKALVADPSAVPAVGAAGWLESFRGLSLEEFDLRCLEAERTYLQVLVSGAKGNLAEAARQAKVRNRNTLISRLKRHGIRGRSGE